MYYNVISSFLWSFTLIFAGHYLYGFLLYYQIDLKNHIELIILGLVILTLSPVLLKFAKKHEIWGLKKWNKIIVG
jgi:membrane-associated protein